MEISDKPLHGPGNELFDGLTKGVAVWGTAWLLSQGACWLLSDLVSRGWGEGIGLVVLFGFVATIFWGGEKWPRLRKGFFAWRYPIAILLAIYIGYQWRENDYRHSREAHLNEAARWACSKNVACQKSAVDYLMDTGFNN